MGTFRLLHPIYNYLLSDNDLMKLHEGYAIETLPEEDLEKGTVTRHNASTEEVMFPTHSSNRAYNIPKYKGPSDNFFPLARQTAKGNM